MKKSLAITTIATILVIVVALTTATFAWFSSNNQTMATSNFTAQTTNAVFTFYPWLSGKGNYDYANGQTTLDFTTATDTTDQGGKFGIFKIEEMKAFVPTAIINAETPATISGGNWAGLPGEKFFTATTSGASLANAYYSALLPTEISNGMPNVARFLLYNGKAESKALDIQVKITAQGKAQDIGVADGLRFVMIGVPHGGNSGEKFIIGTEYQYDGIPDETDLTSVHDFTPEAYSKANTASYTEFDKTGYVSLKAPDTVGVETSGFITYDFKNDDTNLKIDSQKGYEVYLYVWLDGVEITDGSAGGAVQFEINFTVPNAE